MVAAITKDNSPEARVSEIVGENLWLADASAFGSKDFDSVENQVKLSYLISALIVDGVSEEKVSEILVDVYGFPEEAAALRLERRREVLGLR